ncbi:MAG: tRNA (cytidine(34)-2'-O)-methyltransferase [Myxococcota bacterium]
MTKQLHIALVEPEIPQNTGNIGRLCLGMGAVLHVIHPLGFSLSEKAVRRAGLDYWKKVELVEHSNLNAFLNWVDGRPAFALTTKATESYRSVSYPNGSVLIFGPETRGLSNDMRNHFTALRIPMTGEIRSLNLSNAVAIVAYQAMSQIRPAIYGDS